MEKILNRRKFRQGRYQGWSRDSGHVTHFALLTRHLLDYVRDPKSLPAWEKLNMLAKYFVTTGGLKLALELSQK